MARFLGLDASTQSLSGLIIDMDTGTVCANHSVVFGERLPRFHSPKGCLVHEDPRVKHSDPLMWVEALSCFWEIWSKRAWTWAACAG